MAAFPASLPQAASMQVTDEDQAGTIRSEQDTGAPKTRQRFTATIRKITMVMILNGTQRATFNTFYRTTISNGATSFTIPDPLDGSSITVRFKKPVSWQYVGNSGGGTSATKLWRGTLSLEELP
jgi:hypothetical protein